MNDKKYDPRDLLRGISYVEGKCVVCDKILDSVLPLNLILESYSKRYMIKKGYNGIRIATNAQFIKKYGTGLDAVLCLDCFVKAKKEYGWQEGAHYDSDSDVL